MTRAFQPKSLLYSCFSAKRLLKHWRKLSLYSCFAIIGSILVYTVSIWAIGSYRVLSDDPNVWEKDIALLNKEDTNKKFAAGSTLFVGSSSVRMFTDLESVFNSKSVIKKGFGGAKIKDVIHYKEQVIFKYNPKMIVIYLGINDILYRDYDQVNQLTNDFFQLTDEIQQRLPTSQLVVLAIRPFNNETYAPDIAAYNKNLKHYATQHDNVYFINANNALLNANSNANEELLIWDGLHLNKKGYLAWGTHINNLLKEKQLIQ